jgi:hypothetical protein
LRGSCRVDGQSRTHPRAASRQYDEADGPVALRLPRSRFLRSADCVDWRGQKGSWGAGVPCGQSSGPAGSTIPLGIGRRNGHTARVRRGLPEPPRLPGRRHAAGSSGAADPTTVLLNCEQIHRVELSPRQDDWRGENQFGRHCYRREATCDSRRCPFRMVGHARSTRGDGCPRARVSALTERTTSDLREAQSRFQFRCRRHGCCRRVRPSAGVA